MKKIKFYFASCLLITSLISCSSDDDTISSKSDDNGIVVTNLSLSKQNVFVGDKINLGFKSEGQEGVSVTTALTDVVITPLSEISYEISSSMPISGFIDMTFSRDTITELHQVFVNFLAHGAIDKTVDGILLDKNNASYLLLVHGEPEGKRITKEIVLQETGNLENPTEEVINFVENWYYFSKGLSYSINAGRVVTSATVYTEGWTAQIDGGTTQTGESFQYDVNGLGNFSDSEGIVMDDVILKYGLPTEENKFSGTSNFQAYVYSEAFFVFISDNVEDYQGKKVVQIIIN